MTDFTTEPPGGEVEYCRKTKQVSESVSPPRHRAQIIAQLYIKFLTSVSPWRSFRPGFHRWTLLFTCAGVLWRRGAAEAAGGLPPDQNSALHARPGAVPATPGPHRRRQRAGRLSAATPAALTVLPPPDPTRPHPTPPDPTRPLTTWVQEEEEEEDDDAGTQTVSGGAWTS